MRLLNDLHSDLVGVADEVVRAPLLLAVRRVDAVAVVQVASEKGEQLLELKLQQCILALAQESQSKVEDSLGAFGKDDVDDAVDEREREPGVS